MIEGGSRSLFRQFEPAIRAPVSREADRRAAN